jgi:hypothetical protein
MSVGVTYDNDFRVVTQTVNGGTASVTESGRE